MTFPSIIDLAAISGIGALALLLTQYIKDALPVKLIRPCTILSGIGVAFLWFYNPQTGALPDLITVIANGVFGAVLADGGYNFFSAKDSPLFSFPGKETVVKVEETKEVVK